MSIAFVYEHDIWVVPVSGEDEKQLTFGGSDLILHGDLDWVYPEELNVGTGYHWSLDSRHIAFLELDETLGCRSYIHNGVNNLQAHYRWYVTDCF